jgi:hypothetical protein
MGMRVGLIVDIGALPAKAFALEEMLLARRSIDAALAVVAIRRGDPPNVSPKSTRRGGSGILVAFHFAGLLPTPRPVVAPDSK